ncbi:probable protein phosphatase 2C 58 isoform X2 [Tripterygium wilfordii]|nr:probable protein phosphatase 2C 58 isoform X2 [Tripterygium wilfordii]
MKGARLCPTGRLIHEIKRKKPNPEDDVELPKTKDLQHKEYSAEEDFQEDDSTDVKEEAGDDLPEEDDEDKEGENEELLNLRVSHGFYLVEGKMGHKMEDYIVAENREINGHELGLYAIFDGHSGRKVVEYLQSNLFDNILAEPTFWTNPETAIKRAYRETDYEILDKIVGSRGGSAAVTGILIDRQKLIVPNVGDSRAVLCTEGVAKRLSVDHDPEKEKKVVESRGGFVTQMPGNVPRVDGRLAMTRSFGDESLKDHIISKPDIKITTIDTNAEFMILASDGMWKVMSDQEVCDCVGQFNDAQEASEELIKEALSRGSLDDISCMVVMFH